MSTLSRTSLLLAPTQQDPPLYLHTKRVRLRTHHPRLFCASCNYALVPSSSSSSPEADKKGIRTANSVTSPLVAEHHHQHGRHVLHEALGCEAHCVFHVGCDLVLLGHRDVGGRKRHGSGSRGLGRLGRSRRGPALRGRAMMSLALSDGRLKTAKCLVVDNLLGGEQLAVGAGAHL